MNILQLFEHLNITGLTSQFTDPTYPIHRIEFLNNEFTEWDSNTLYICKSLIQPSTSQSSKLLNFMIENSDEGYSPLKNMNLIFVPNNQLKEMMDRTKEILKQEVIVKDAKERLFHETISGKEMTVSSLLQTAYDLLGNPVVLTSSTFRLIDMVPYKTLNDPIWDCLYEKRFLHQDYIMLLEADMTRKKTLESTRPIYLNWSWAEEIPRISGVIMDGNHVFGYLGVLEYNRPFIEADYEITNLLCVMFRNLLINNNSSNYDSLIMQQTFLANLLDGGVTSKESLEQAGTTINLRLRGPYSILVVPLSLSNSYTNLQQIQDKLRTNIANIHLINHRGNIVLLLFGKKLADSLETSKRILSKGKLPLAISETYFELMDTPIYYRQAVIAYELGEKRDETKTYYKYSDYVHQHLIQSAIKQEKSNVFVYPGITVLIEYDHANNTQYGLTLQTFLQHYKSITETSKKLQIHRNTLTYRLRKAEEIVNFSLDNISQCRHVQLSLEILLEH
jgi:sugar diacid utilization regulator